MTEIIDLAKFNRALDLALIIVPALWLIVWAAVRRLGRWGLAAWVLLFALSWASVAVWLMWRVYNLVIAHFGLDSVAGLLVNLVIFVIAGVLAGAAVRAIARRMGPIQIFKEDRK